MKVFFLGRMLPVCLYLLVGLGFSQEVYGVGAYPYPQKIEQADGTVLTIRLHGDEWFNWTSTVDGYRIKRNLSGIYEYASVLKSGDAQSSGIRASDPAVRTDEEVAFLTFLEKGSGVSPMVIQEKRQSKTAGMLKSTNDANVFAASGTQKLLVILANFSNTSPSHTQQSFDNLMNQEGYNGTGSFRDYYLENSGGQLNMVSIVTQWVTVPNNKAYYAPDTLWGEFALHAIEAAAAAGVDFSEFDNNGNGTVEGISIIHQGPGQEVTGSEEDIWSHSWTLSSAGYNTSERTFNGVYVNSYTLQPETRNATGSINTMGVVAHEFGHNLGLPDYYDTNTADDITYEGTGRWDMMASGTYNGSPSGSSPAHHNPLSKYELGWVEMVQLTTAGPVEISPIQEAGIVYRINGPVDHEYLLLENRRKQGFDAFVPGEGLIVYHADDDQINKYRNSNSINTQAHQGFYVMAAGGDINTASAPFPGTLNVSQLTDETDPAMITWTGEVFNRSMTGIFEQNNTIYFDYMAVQNGSPLSLEVNLIESDELNLIWEPSLSGAPVLLAWSETGFFGTPVAGQLYSPGDALVGGGTVLYYGALENSFLHGGLLGSKRYYYSIWSDLEGEWSASLMANGLTNPMAITAFPWYEGFEMGLPNWRQFFTSGNFEWKTSAKGDNDLPAAPYEGETMAYFHAPQFEQRITTLVSPFLELQSGQTYLMDFRHYQASWEGDQDWLKVLVKPEGGSEWTELAYLTDEATEWMQRRVEIPFSEPVQIAFQGISNYGYGIGVDDLKVYVGPHCNATLTSVSGVTLNNFTETSMDVSWDMPASTNVLVVMRKDGIVTDLPDGGVSYTAGAVFGQGDVFPDGSSVVYAGNGNGVEITGLDHTSDYHLAIFSYTDEHCYGLEAVRANYSTVQVFYPLSITVSFDGQPLEGALVTLGEEPKVTDVAGKVTWSVGHSDIYLPVSVEHSGFVSQWQRCLPHGEQALNVDLVAVDLPVPRNLRHTKSLKSVTLNWDPVINELFDGYAPFALSMTGWSMEDKDQLKTYSFSGLSFPEENYIGSFIILDPYYEGLLQADFDMTAYSGRQVLAAFASPNGANDDWLISPELEVYAGDGFSFMARSISSAYGLESIRVLVSDQSDGSGEFTLLSAETVQVPVGWTAYSFDLSAYAGKRVKVAIQYVSNKTFALILDQISIGPYTEPELVSSAVESSVSARRVATDQSLLRADKDAVRRVIGAAAPDKGRIAYGIQLNGGVVGETIGFSATTFSMNVSNCLGNEFQLQSKDVVYPAVSPWSVSYLVNACHAVSFVVFDNDSQPIEGALVKFETYEALTDANGEVLFLGIENLSEASFEVSANGFMPESGQLLVMDDIETLVLLEPVLTDSTAVKDKEIRVFPNPVRDELSVNGIYGEIEVSVYDLSGRMVKSMQVEAYYTFTLPMSDLQSGMYVLKFKVGGRAFLRKFVKQ